MALARSVLFFFLGSLVALVIWKSNVNVDTVMDQYSRGSGRTRQVTPTLQNAQDAHRDGGSALRGSQSDREMSSASGVSSQSGGTESLKLGGRNDQGHDESSTVTSSSHSGDKESSSQASMSSTSTNAHLDAASLGKNASVNTLSTETLVQLLNDTDKVLSKMRFISDHIFPPDFKLSYLPNYKTPCFMEGDAKWCLPYFFIGGFPKCGTTELFAKLVQHPQILKGKKKEPHWWTRFRYTNENSLFGHYKNFFKKRVNAISKTVDENGQHPLILTEGSASTVWDNKLLFSEHLFHTPPHLNIHAIHAVLPDARFVLILRNPVTRLYSDYLYFQKKYSPENFHAQVVKSIRIFNECLQHPQKSFLYCIYAPSPAHSPPLFFRLRVALYYVHLKVVLSVYPRSNLFILQLENYMQDEVTWLQKIMTFLDVSVMSANDIEEIIQKRKAANSNKKGYKKSGPMLEETRALLEDFYKPFNILLKMLLGEESLAY